MRGWAAPLPCPLREPTRDGTTFQNLDAFKGHLFGYLSSAEFLLNQPDLCLVAAPGSLSSHDNERRRPARTTSWYGTESDLGPQTQNRMSYWKDMAELANLIAECPRSGKDKTHECP